MPSKEELEKEIEEVSKEIKKLKERKMEILETTVREVNVKKASIIEKDGNQRGIVALWEDGHVTVCIGDEKGKGECYTTSKEEGEKLYYIALAWVAGLGADIKPLE